MTRLADGSAVVYTPAAGFAGLDSFTYTITDGFSHYSTASVQITVAAVPHIIFWQSVLTHGRGVGEAALTIPDDNTFSEPRYGGIQRLLVAFDEPIAASSFLPASVVIAGNNANNLPVDLSSIVVTTSFRNGNTVGVIDFSQPLPDYARYLVRIQGVTDLSGNPLSGDNDRIMTALKGDASGDLQVDSSDSTAVRALTTGLINSANVAQVRADLTMDGQVNASDLSIVRAATNHDARAISNPIIASNQIVAGNTSSNLSVGLSATAAAAVINNVDTTGTIDLNRPLTNIYPVRIQDVINVVANLQVRDYNGAMSALSSNAYENHGVLSADLSVQQGRTAYLGNSSNFVRLPTDLNMLRLLNSIYYQSIARTYANYFDGGGPALALAGPASWEIDLQTLLSLKSGATPYKGIQLRNTPAALFDTVFIHWI